MTTFIVIITMIFPLLLTTISVANEVEGNITEALKQEEKKQNTINYDGQIKEKTENIITEDTEQNVEEKTENITTEEKKQNIKEKTEETTAEKKEQNTVKEIQNMTENITTEVKKEENTNSHKNQIEEKEQKDIQPQARSKKASQEIEEGIYEIYTGVSGTKVIDIAGGSKKDGANVDIYERGNQGNQKIRIKKNEDGTYMLIALHSNKVLDVEGSGKKNGTNVCQYKNYGGEGQKWYMEPCGEGYYHIISKVNGLYLDVTGGLGRDGQNIEVWRGNGGKGQKFKLVKEITRGEKTIENGIYYLKAGVAENRLLEVPNSETRNEEEIRIGAKNEKANQKFQVMYNQDGTYTITALHSGKALDVRYGSGKNKGIIQQYGKHGKDSQKWIIVKNSDNTYSIIAKCSGLAIDVEAGSTKVGAKVQTYRYHGNKSQKFRFQACEVETGSQSVEDGTYRILSKGNVNRVMTVEGGSIANGAKIRLNENVKNSSQQKFAIEYIGNGYYKIRGKKSNKVLTVESANPRVGSEVKQEEDKNADSQKWILKKYKEGVYGIISKCGNLYVNVENGQEIRLRGETDLKEQQFVLVNETVRNKGKQIENGVYQIVTKGNKVIDIAGGSYKNVGNALIWNNTKVQQQKYQITRIGNTEYYKIIAVHSGKSLDIEGGNTNPGANVIQYTYGGTANQQWIIKEVGEGYYEIISKESGLCLDVTGGQISKAGANLELWYHNGADAQKFKFIPIPMISNDSYQISTKINANQYLDIAASSQADNGNLQVWSKNNANNQIFRVENIDKHNYRIIARHSNKVLTVATNKNVVQATDVNAENQKWSFEPAGNGYYQIKSNATGYYLHINGSNVQVAPKQSLANQMFKLNTLPQRKGIDVSEHNGLINWEFVKRSGVEFAIIRVGYRGYRTGAFAEDRYFKMNMEGAKKAGLKIGVYFFSQAVNEAEAREEANWTVNKIKSTGYANDIDYPIIIDTELSGGNPPGRADALNVQTRTAVCRTFCETVKSRGYRPMIYASRDWFYHHLDMTQLNQYEIWVAHYTGSPQNLTNYKHHYEIWQYTSNGQVMGVQGRIDLNISYQSY